MSGKRRFLLLGIGVMLTASLITACGEEKNIDYSIDGMEEELQPESDSSNDGKSAVSQFAEETKWSEVWTIETGEEETVEITIEADIILPDAEEMSVVEVTVPEMDEAFKERIVKEIFEEGNVYYREEDSEESFVLEDEYGADEYLGEMAEIDFVLWFGKTGDGAFTGDGFDQWFNLFPENNRDVCPEEYEEYTHFLAHSFMTMEKYNRIAENECEISQEEAEKIAENFLAELGLEYPVLAEARPLIWGDETLTSDTVYDWPANGYVFTYDYGLGKVSFTSSASYAYETYSVEDDVAQYSMLARVMVYVTDKGVISMYMGNPVETVNMYEKVELLALETIKEIMKEEVEAGYENFHFVHMMSAQELQFTRMELIYFRVRDKQNAEHYTYVPAWRLSEELGKLGNDIIVRNPVIINAIDGTLIDFYEET